MANVASKYILKHPAVGAVIIGARLGEREYIENNQSLLNFTPEEQDWKEIKVAINSGADGRTQALSGTVWEDIAGFSRAVRKGDRILVSGTTATHGDKVIGGQDPGAQTQFVIDKIEGAIQSLGGRLEDVVRTRIYIRNIDDWEPVSRAHGQRFGHIQPANTLVQAGLIGDDYLVEIEAEATLAAASQT